MAVGYDDPQSNDHAVLYIQTLAPASWCRWKLEADCDEIAFYQIVKVYM